MVPLGMRSMLGERPQPFATKPNLQLPFAALVRVNHPPLGLAAVYFGKVVLDQRSQPNRNVPMLDPDV